MYIHTYVMCMYIHICIKFSCDLSACILCPLFYWPFLLDFQEIFIYLGNQLVVQGMVCKYFSQLVLVFELCLFYFSLCRSVLFYVIKLSVFFYGIQSLSHEYKYYKRILLGSCVVWILFLHCNFQSFLSRCSGVACQG